VSKIEASGHDRYNVLLSRIEELDSRSRDRHNEMMLRIEGGSIGRNEAKYEILLSQNTLNTHVSRLKVLNRNFEAPSVIQDYPIQYLPALLAATQSVPATIQDLISLRDQILQQSAPQALPFAEFVNSNMPKSACMGKFPSEALNILDKIMYVLAQSSVHNRPD
jgi:hypothetical protein